MSLTGVIAEVSERGSHKGNVKVSNECQPGQAACGKSNGKVSKDHTNG